MGTTPLTAHERFMMEHALGVGRGTEPPGWRNHYCIGIGGDDEKVWSGLASRGLAKRGRDINEGRDAVFMVTDAGRVALGLPAAPPRLTPEETPMERKRPTQAVTPGQRASGAHGGVGWVDSTDAGPAEKTRAADVDTRDNVLYQIGDFTMVLKMPRGARMDEEEYHFLVASLGHYRAEPKPE